MEALGRARAHASIIPETLRDVMACDNVDEVVVLSTCARTEVYATVSCFHGAVTGIRKLLAEWSGMATASVGVHLYSFHGYEAVQHLFRVAAGADSALLGEGEILRQVRAAWDTAFSEHCAGSTLSALFRQAIEVGKRVRSETAIARGTTSLPHIAIDMAVEHFGSLAGRTSIVIGAGSLGVSLATGLATVSKGGPVLIANRTRSRGAELAQKIEGRVVAWDDLRETLPAVDMVITSTGSTEALFDVEFMADVLRKRLHRPLLVIDVGVPKDVEPAVGQLDGVTLLSLEDLIQFVHSALEVRRSELPPVDRIISAEVDRYFTITAQRSATPVVVGLREKAEGIRVAEMARFEDRLALLDDRQRQTVEALTRGLVAKLLHEPTVNMKAAAGSTHGPPLAAALCHLFAIQPSDDSFF
jgi:glutamyl-tRNA reductase